MIFDEYNLLEKDKVHENSNASKQQCTGSQNRKTNISYISLFVTF